MVIHGPWSMVPLMQVVLVGDATVGKTHLLSRYVKGETTEGPLWRLWRLWRDQIQRVFTAIGSPNLCDIRGWTAIGTLPKAPTATIGVEFATRQGLKMVGVKFCTGTVFQLPYQPYQGA